MAKIKAVHNLKKKLTKEELEELALKDQAVEIIEKAQSEAVAFDLGSLPHYADASGGTGATGVALLTEGGAVAGGLTVGEIGLGLFVAGGVLCCGRRKRK